MAKNKDKEFLLEWNSLFPLDYWWRKKYNIPFNSKKHRRISYIDIYYEWLEEEVYKEYFDEIGNKEEKRKHYESTGEWFSFKPSEEEEEKLLELFDKIDVSEFNIEDK